MFGERGRQVRLFTNWRLTAATKQRTPDDADMCSLCALKMLLADQEVRAITLCRVAEENLSAQHAAFVSG